MIHIRRSEERGHANHGWHEAPDKPLTLVLKHSDGSEDTIIANHTYNKNQIDWFKAGSALNLIKQQQ